MILDDTTKSSLILMDEEAFYQAIQKLFQQFKAEQKEGDIYLSESETMKMLKITSKTTLWNYRNSGKLPYYQINKRVILYLKSEVEEFIKQHKVNTF